MMKKVFRIIGDTLTIRPIRKFIERKLVEMQIDCKFRHTPKFDKSIKIHKKSGFIGEPNFAHGECLPGWTKYFQDLDYAVDIFTRYENFAEKPFCRYQNPPRIFAGSLPMLKKWLGDKRIAEYEVCFLASSVIWDFSSHMHFSDYLGFMPQGKLGCLFIDHAPNVFFEQYNEKTLARQNRIFTLSHLPEMPQLNPHYFGEFSKNKKNKKTIFLTIGRINAKNYDPMVESVRELAKSSKDFVVRVIGIEEMEIPADLRKYITYLGRIDYPKMYTEIEQADFIIAGLDSFCAGHYQYLVGCTTGNLQLSLGFLKPMLISRIFGEHYELSDKSAILYPDNELFGAMESAMKMNGSEYVKMQTALQSLADKIYGRSLTNLKSAMKSDHKAGIKTNMAFMCKTYIKDLLPLKILKESIDVHNVDKIPFYIVVPAKDLEQIKSAIITGKEDYKIAAMPEESILDGESLGMGWLDQQVVKLKFYKTNLCDFYLILDSDSYFIKDFFVDDFMFDDETPYVVCHEGKAGTLLNTKFGNTNAMHEKEQFIKKFFGRKGKDYRFLTSPFMFSSAVCRALDVELGAAHCIRLCSCEAAWHGEFLLKSGAKYKPTELFFEAMVYQKKLNWWRKLRITTNDISKQYLGIVMQSKFLKEHRYEN
ncbi:MAG: DUF6492 family protein [Puniceicoccales bacterium]|jgi:hypothetical protein|nr:DUF6492 family protein [Puniceicoccales bacterium]